MLLGVVHEKVAWTGLPSEYGPTLTDKLGEPGVPLLLPLLLACCAEEPELLGFAERNGELKAGVLGLTRWSSCDGPNWVGAVGDVASVHATRPTTHRTATREYFGT